MKQLLILTFFFNCCILNAQSVQLDTLVDIGTHKIHFNIIKGEGIPILFDSGAGDDGTVWNDLLKPIHDITGTTLITYDRAGFGKSEINPTIETDEGHGILNGIEELEIALKKLGYFNNLILVSHSYGGFYSTLLSARNPSKILFNVRIDANLAQQYTEDILVKAEQDNSVQEMKGEHLGLYYLGINFANTVRLMWETEYPKSVPAIDIVSPIQRHHTDDEWNLLIKTHEDFVKAETNRTGIIAYGSGHYIFKDNHGLVFNAIVKAYVSTLNDDKKKLEILNKSLNKSMDLFIEAKKKDK
jgi:hypothetical protein